MFVVEEQKNIKNRIDIRSVVAITQRLGFKLRTDGVRLSAYGGGFITARVVLNITNSIR